MIKNFQEKKKNKRKLFQLGKEEPKVQLTYCAV